MKTVFLLATLTAMNIHPDDLPPEIAEAEKKLPKYEEPADDPSKTPEEIAIAEAEIDKAIEKFKRTKLSPKLVQLLGPLEESVQWKIVGEIKTWEVLVRKYPELADREKITELTLRQIVKLVPEITEDKLMKLFRVKSKEMLIEP